MGLLQVYFRKFVSKLRPLIDVRILFPLNILWTTHKMDFDQILPMHWY